MLLWDDEGPARSCASFGGLHNTNGPAAASHRRRYLEGAKNARSEHKRVYLRDGVRFLGGRQKGVPLHEGRRGTRAVQHVHSRQDDGASVLSTGGSLHPPGLVQIYRPRRGSAVMKIGPAEPQQADVRQRGLDGGCHGDTKDRHRVGKKDGLDECQHQYQHDDFTCAYLASDGRRDQWQSCQCRPMGPRHLPNLGLQVEPLSTSHFRAFSGRELRRAHWTDQ